MAKVAVSRPDRLGWRRVTIDGHPIGKARSPKGLKALLLRAPKVPPKYEIKWDGGDEHVWMCQVVWRHIEATFMVLGLGFTAYLLTKIGAKDAFSALTYAGRMTGITLLVAAALEVVAVGAAIEYWHWGREDFSGMIVLIGTSLSFIVGMVLLAVQSWCWSYTAHLWLWICLTLWSVLAMVILVRRRVWKGVPHPRRVALGALVTGLLTVTNLVYTQVYVPYATSPLVQSSAVFGKPTLDEKRREMYVPIRLFVKNEGRIPVYILGSIYWVHGGAANVGSRNELIHDGEFVKPPGRSLNPGEEFVDDELIEIRKPNWGRYEALQMQTELYTIRKDRMTIVGDYERSGANLATLKKEGKEKDPQGPNEDYFRYQADISNSSEILNMTRGPERVTLWYTHRKNWPYLYVDVAPPGERIAFDPCKRDANKEAITRYGLERVRGSTVQKPLAELLEGAEVEPSSQPLKPEPKPSTPKGC
ncbi:hypothetical protein AB0953_01480 [Streptomyces sp. NPDC046866]|uniref:hypothetical protein n=1 Tax=Streptomyces sp. NPDC046866 TaxID=3154921 RepID=UPI003453FC75